MPSFRLRPKEFPRRGRVRKRYIRSDIAAVRLLSNFRDGSGGRSNRVGRDAGQASGQGEKLDPRRVKALIGDSRVILGVCESYFSFVDLGRLRPSFVGQELDHASILPGERLGPLRESLLSLGVEQIGLRSPGRELDVFLAGPLRRLESFESRVRRRS